MAFKPIGLCDKTREKLLARGLTDDDITGLIDELAIELRESGKKYGKISGEARDEAVTNWLNKKEEHQKRLLHQKLLTKQAINDFKRYSSEFTNKYEALKSYISGSNELRPGTLNSLDSMTKSLENKAAADLEIDFSKIGADIDIFLKLDDRDFAIELSNQYEGGTPGITKNELARQFAEIVKKHQDYWVDRLNRAGAYINKLPGYIVRHTHNISKVSKAGLENWKSFIKELLDYNKTFLDEGIDPLNEESVDQFLDRVFKDIITGKYEVDNSVGGAGGSLNLANKLGRKRILHFNDVESELKYNEMFGSKSITETAYQGLRRSARNAALLERLGPDPEGTLNKISKEIIDDAALNHEKYPKEIKSKLQGIKYQFYEITGHINIPENTKLAVSASVVRKIEDMAKLGFSTITSIVDTASIDFNLKYLGVPLAKRIATVLRVLLRGKPKGEQAELARLLGLGFDEMSSIGSRFTNVETIPGNKSVEFINTLHKKYFKYNLLEAWTIKSKQVTGLVLSTHIGNKVDLAFDQLPTKLQRVFKQYGVTPERWDIIRKAKTIEYNDNKFLIPEYIHELPDKVFEKLLKKNPSKSIQSLKDELETQVRTIFAGEMDRAVPTPGAKERYYIHWGQRPGTVWGEVGRTTMQFKTFPMTFVTKNIGRSVSTGLKSAETYSNMAELILGTTFMGYVSLVCNDILHGKSPRDITDTEYTAKILGESFLKGGAAGLYGDLIFGSLGATYGHGIVEQATGPTVSTIVDAWDILSDVAKGKTKKIPSKVVGLLKNNTPFANMWYTKLALDNLIIYNLQEAVNPGYLLRKRLNTKKSTGQHYFITPKQRW